MPSTALQPLLRGRLESQLDHLHVLDGSAAMGAGTGGPCGAEFGETRDLPSLGEYIVKLTWTIQGLHG